MFFFFQYYRNFCPCPGLIRFRRPLPEIPGDNRKAGVNMTTRYALYTGSGSSGDLASSS
jgi:hypothetical protein